MAALPSRDAQRGLFGRREGPEGVGLTVVKELNPITVPQRLRESKARCAFGALQSQTLSRRRRDGLRSGHRMRMRRRFGGQRGRRRIACLPLRRPRGSVTSADPSNREAQNFVVDEAERAHLAELKLQLTEPLDRIQLDSLSVDVDDVIRSVDNYDAPLVRRLDLRGGAQGTLRWSASHLPGQMQPARAVRTWCEWRSSGDPH